MHRIVVCVYEHYGYVYIGTFNLCGIFRWSPEGPISQIHSPHLHVGDPAIFSYLLRSVQMLKIEWHAESNRKLSHLFIPSKTATLVPEFAVEDMHLGRTATLGLAFPTKDLPLGKTLWWWWWYSGTARVHCPHIMKNWVHKSVPVTIYCLTWGLETAHKVFHSVLGQETGNNRNIAGCPWRRMFKTVFKGRLCRQFLDQELSFPLCVGNKH